jgi:FixJ family two-component response regulator
MVLAVVDDDGDVRVALGRLLRSLGHAVHLFPSAEDFERDTPEVDCIILDVRLPGLNGFEFHDRMRTNGCSTPVVFITGDTDPRAKDDPRRNNAPALNKPFDGDTLMAAIGDAISAASSVR